MSTIINLLGADGVKKLAMTTLKAEAEIINALYPMSKGGVESIVRARDEEIAERYGAD